MCKYRNFSVSYFSIFGLNKKIYFELKLWRRGVVVITAAQLHSTKSGHRFCVDANPADGVSEICDGENL